MALLAGIVQRYGCVLVRSLFLQRRYPPTHRRKLLFCLAFLTMYPLVELFHAGCLLLDGVLLALRRRPALAEPVFLIGNPRSGTTIAHRVLALDTERFFCFKTWQILFPSLWQKYALTVLGWCDRCLGRPGERLIRWRESRLFDEFNRLHQVGLFLPEEDDKLMVHILAATDLAVFFPYGGFECWARLDEQVPRAQQDAVFRFYRGCVLRQACFAGADRALLSKNPFFSGKVDALQRHFPDARFVYLVRNPLDVVGSTISMARAMIRLSLGIEPAADLDETVYDLVKYFYRYPLARLRQLPPERWTIIRYDDLIREPKAAFVNLYRHFGWTMSPQFETRLDQQVAEMRQHKSRHSYSLDTTSITPERIVAELREVFEEFGFDTRGYAPGAPASVPASPETASATT
jgi:hypothetical protein